MLDIQGQWQVSYAAVTDPSEDPFDEHASLRLWNGRITGTDVAGAVYEGAYVQTGDDVYIDVIVNRGPDTDSFTVFSSLDFPLSVKIRGKYTSPDHFSATGEVNESQTLAVTCRRVAERRVITRLSASDPSKVVETWGPVDRKKV